MTNHKPATTHCHQMTPFSGALVGVGGSVKAPVLGALVSVVEIFSVSVVPSRPETEHVETSKARRIKALRQFLGLCSWLVCLVWRDWSFVPFLVDYLIIEAWAKEEVGSTLSATSCADDVASLTLLVSSNSCAARFSITNSCASS